MPNNQPVRLVSVLTEIFGDAMQGASDKWVRIELPKDWPIIPALQNIQSNIPGLRLGVLLPFQLPDIAAIESPSSDNPSVITGWRNQPAEQRSLNPTIILGDARGREEAGLRLAPRIISTREVFEKWQSTLSDWLSQHIPSKTPVPLFKHLFELAVSGDIDAVQLDEYATSALQVPMQALPALRGLLWKINLFPDERVLDTGLAASRLDQNLETRQLLLAATDVSRELESLERLRNAAAEGNPNAKKALQYRTQQDNVLLEGIQLDDLCTILAPRSEAQPNQSRRSQRASGSTQRVGLLEFFNRSSGARLDLIQGTLQDLSNRWDLDNVDGPDLLASFNLPNVTTLDVEVRLRPRKKIDSWISTGTPGEQKLTFLAETDSIKSWDPFSPLGRPITGDRLLGFAKAQDINAGSPIFEDLVTAYLAARGRLARYEPWLAESKFELLLLHSPAREAIQDYLAAWQALVNAANERSPEEVALIRKTLVLLEAIWAKKQSQETFEYCLLGPLHPYILDPLLRLANYTLASLGREHLGRKVAWALDRCLPAYRMIWAPGTTLFLGRANQVYQFQVLPQGDHPSLEEGNGIYQVARAFLGFHPYAKEGLVITLVDPPKGTAIGSNLQRLRNEVRQLRVYLVTTRGDTNRLDEQGDFVRDLGRFSNLEDWQSHGAIRSHILFYFAERSSGTTAVLPSGWGPTPGAHVALKIGLESPSPFDSPDILSPYVTLEPRQSNSPVVALQRLAEPSLGSPRLFKVQPMLGEEISAQFARVAELTDWVVIGAPSPLGLITPQKLGQGLTYLGREAMGTYGLFAYATTLFPIRKSVTQRFVPSPVIPDINQVETQMADLALKSANAVLRVGQNEGALWEQIGVMVSSELSRSLNE